MAGILRTRAKCHNVRACDLTRLQSRLAPNYFITHGTYFITTQSRVIRIRKRDT